ncbi:unnamed protein product [Medioppia subpectinata]|uniref:Uncharacterized protein n=1 Tax=Medioppia subpectinata TaxID=1979941 RepID=A0A7R9KIT8_9ACAR|nr:unnamed protein product [Medioppia subpectinata]CAG2104046.1 unnamed protein product [Medioppia subpectinata]
MKADLRLFLWDKAKEVVEKERDSQRLQQNQSSIMCSMMTALAQMSVADKNYIHLHFLAPKGFLRKDVVKGMYETLRSEFEKLHERGNAIVSTETDQLTTLSTPNTTLANVSNTPLGASLNTSSSSSSILSIAASFSSALILTSSPNSQMVSNSKATQECLDRLAAHICGQLVHYVRARIEMMEIYEKITIVSNHKFLLFDECINGLQEIIRVNGRHFHHPILSAIKTGFNNECDILMALLKAHTDIQNFRFLDSLFGIQEAQTKLSSWAQMSLNRESPQRRNSILRTTASPPPLYQWMCRLKSSLLSKYSLYFYSTLSKQVSDNCSNDIKTVCSKQSIDYIQKVCSFQRKTEAQFVAILFDTHGCDDYKGFGYYSPYKSFESPKGIDSIPIIYNYPSEVPKNHLPTIIMIMNNKSKELNSSDAVVSLFDSQLNSTYFLIRPDPRMTLIV